jgi:hypothetical protein
VKREKVDEDDKDEANAERARAESELSPRSTDHLTNLEEDEDGSGDGGHEVVMHRNDEKLEPGVDSTISDATPSIASIDELGWSGEVSSYGSMSQSDDCGVMVLEDHTLDHTDTSTTTTTATARTTMVLEEDRLWPDRPLEAEELDLEDDDEVAAEDQRRQYEDDGEDQTPQATLRQSSRAPVPTIVVDDDDEDARQRQLEGNEHGCGNEASTGDDEGVEDHNAHEGHNIFPSSPLQIDPAALPRDRERLRRRNSGGASGGRRHFRRSLSK